MAVAGMRLVGRREVEGRTMRIKVALTGLYVTECLLWLARLHTGSSSAVLLRTPPLLLVYI